MNIGVEISGEQEVITHLTGLPARVHAAVLAKVGVLTLKLEDRVKKKLSGEVLNVVTGKLRRSVNSNVEDEGAQIVGTVNAGANVPYARIHEFGGTTSPHVIEPIKAKVLSFLMGGKRVFARKVNHPGSKMPERSYMRSSLAEMRQTIIDDIKSAALTAAVGK